MANILITGGSGLLGKVISEQLIKKNHTVTWLSREAGHYKSIKKYKWNVEKGTIDTDALKDVNCIMHLAGCGIADKRWSESYKNEIIDSRVKSSELLFKTLTKANIKINSFIGGSAIGYYGANQSEKIINENNEAGTDFLAHSCVLWEKSYDAFIESNIRTAIIRIGVILSKDGGAYPKMALSFKYGFGAGLASGNQFFPWIHIHDIASLFVFAFENSDVNGIYNGVGSEFITNKNFSKQLATSFKRPFFLPNIPKVLLNLAMGEGACMVTEGLKISNQKIKDLGFRLKFETVELALKDLAR